MKERNILLDGLRGFAILLVVLGHSIQLNQINFDDNILFNIIYSFHMPLFMFISGFLSYKTFDGSIQKLYKKFKYLIIPFFAWFFVTFLFSHFSSIFAEGGYSVFLSEFKGVLISPDKGLWFLWVLFLNYVVLFASLRISKKYEEITAFLFLILINIILRLSPDFALFGLFGLASYLLYFLIGYIMHKYFLKIKTPLKLFCYFSLAIFPILVVFWSRVDAPIFIKNLSPDSGVGKLIFIAYKLLVPITGIFATYILFDALIIRNNFLKRFFSYFGKISLEIYTTHVYFFSFMIFLFNFFKFKHYHIFIAFIGSIIGSIILQFLIKKNDILSVILFGKPKTTQG